ncbi:RNA-binding protein 34 [Lucilia sericata]|uniref:RNA-binding protein 34 n=1 Tax=Lucilia sericata TaxID=13632 RepID=UPI0018A8733D|nr:RNA-binding protein 34 [Lucilia sericata]
MKKVKNTESKVINTSLESVKEGKVKKNKPKKEKKLKDAVAKTEDLNLAPKIESTNLKPNNSAADKTKNKNKKNKNKPAKTEENEKPAAQATQKEANDEKPKKQKPTKKNLTKEKKSEAETPVPTKALNDEELKKVEKKKAKKLAQKLKRQQNKAENRAINVKVVTTNGEKNVPTSNKDLSKKEKKIEQRQLLKKQKAEKKAKNVKAAESAPIKIEQKKVDPTSSMVLLKKERKAERRQLLKEQKNAEKQTRDPAMEAATVFVGNLPPNTKRVQIIRLFKDFAPINSIRLRSAGGQVLFKHKQRRTAGALNAYVVLKSKETAEKATTLNGVEFKGHHLRITLAAKNPQSHEKEQAKKTVFVGNLKYTATEESLREIFSSCGEIDYVRCIRDGDKGCKGVAYVCFKTADAVGLALELNQTIVDERPINVERFSVRKLGAKEARDAQAEREEKSQKGAKKRIDNKKGGKKDKAGPKKTSNSKGVDGEEAKKPKKSEFRGVKVEGLKKKPKTKKKKSNDQMQLLAKKIAPKVKTE